MSGGYRYLFGPVPSRRFGRSLGIDLVPLKTCTFNCLFCQVGPTPATTLERREYAPIDNVLGEFEHWREHDGQADVVTLSGSGEPTLHSRFGEVIQAVKSGGGIPAVLLTNSSLLHLEEVRRAAALADVVKVSLSAWDQRSFETINRPHADCSFTRTLEGLFAFRGAFQGQLWLEVFVLKGLNDTVEAAEHLAALAETFSPDRIHLNTVARPPAETSAKAASASVLEDMARQFDPKGEVIARFSGETHPGQTADEERVLAVLSRRPCTGEDVADGLGVHRMAALKILEILSRKGRISSTRRGNQVYYQVCGKEG